MSIRTPKGPRGRVLPNVNEKAAAAKTDAARRRRRPEPEADEFERIADSMDGDDNVARREMKKRDRATAQRRMVQQVISKATRDVSQLESEAARILAVLASGAYSLGALERHKRELSRIRAKLNKARRQMLKGRRSIIEAESGVDEIPESRLSRVHHELDQLQRYSTEWGRALAAVDLACDLGSPEEPRRVKVRGAERQAALTYAESSNPTTAIADLAVSALRMVERPAETAKPKADGLGRTLDALQLLERMINPGETE